MKFKVENGTRKKRKTELRRWMETVYIQVKTKRRVWGLIRLYRSGVGIIRTSAAAFSPYWRSVWDYSFWFHQSIHSFIETVKKPWNCRNKCTQLNIYQSVIEQVALRISFLHSQYVNRPIRRMWVATRCRTMSKLDWLKVTLSNCRKAEFLAHAYQSFQQVCIIVHVVSTCIAYM